jgi:hypothetical protein
MRQCDGITAAGGRCKGRAISEDGYCYLHDPSRAAERRRTASRAGRAGGRGRPQVEVAQIKHQLADLGDALLSGQVERGVAAVAAQIHNVRLKAITTGLQVEEQTELISRMEALETAIEAQKAQRRYGA